LSPRTVNLGLACVATEQLYQLQLFAHLLLCCEHHALLTLALLPSMACTDILRRAYI
jgi:hypothetical protein